MKKYGIDVSYAQGKIDWPLVKQSGVQFAMLRAGYGRERSQKDSTFEYNYREATAAGIPVGAYHFSCATDVAGIAMEAMTMLEWLSGKRFSYPVVLDIETKRQSTLAVDTLVEMIRTYTNILEQAGYFVTVYSYRCFLDRIGEQKLRPWSLWVAEYGAENKFRGSWDLWQFSNHGRVAGIRGDVDENICTRDFPTIIEAGGFNGFVRYELEVLRLCNIRSAPSLSGRVVRRAKKGERLQAKFVATDSQGMAWFALRDGRYISSRQVKVIT